MILHKTDVYVYAPLHVFVERLGDAPKCVLYDNVINVLCKML